MSSREFYPPSVYAKQLARLGYGYPLWFPEPEDGHEVQLGDVGFIDGGRFRRLFNAMTGEGFYTEQRPEGFERLEIDERFIRYSECLQAGFYSSNMVLYDTPGYVTSYVPFPALELRIAKLPLRLLGVAFKAFFDAMEKKAPCFASRGLQI